MPSALEQFKKSVFISVHPWFHLWFFPMKALLSWLKEFGEIPVAPKQLRNDLTMAGLAVDGVTEEGGEVLLELDLTTNRPDCLNHFGLAREIATLYSRPLKPIVAKPKESATASASVTKVEIADPDLCGRYIARVIRGVKVGPSPEWLKKRLEAFGFQSINNVVDATNYVLAELGHPLHAFDMDTLIEQRVVVRRAKPGEKIRTLDGVERTLARDNLVIADARVPVALAGVMGGGATEISFRSKNVLLESAWFDPISIRRTAKSLGLRTEASVRFERGADIGQVAVTADRCAQLIQELTGGEVLAGAVDCFPGRKPRPNVAFTRHELLRVMGHDVPDEVIERILGSLGFAPKRISPGVWQCSLPTWRLDVTREIDLIEEVARHYGFDKFPSRLPAAKIAAARLPHAAKEERIGETLRGLGYDEIISIPLESTQDNARFSELKPVRLANPIAEDASELRTSGLPGMVRALAWNLNRGQKNLRLCEIGKRYFGDGTTPKETWVLTVGATGQVREKSVQDEARAYGFADLKGAVESVLSGFETGLMTWAPLADVTFFHTGRSAQVEAKGRRLAALGQVSPRVAEDLKLRQEVYLAELDLEALYRLPLRARRYEPLSRFPAVERDFSLILRDGISFGAVAEEVRRLGIRELAGIEPVDLFCGKQVPDGHFSLLLRFTFQSAEATLTEEQINGYCERVIQALEKTFEAKIRR